MIDVLPVREAYRLWAPSYERENVLTALDEEAVARLSPPATRLLDAGCGTGRRMPACGAVGVDLVVEMLVQGARKRVAAGDLEALPVRPGSVDVIWCRLAAGHLESLDALLREAARALAPGGALVVTDFHSRAVERGLTRTFKDGAGRLRAVEHVVHTEAAHRAAAARAGLTVDAVLELAVGESVRSYFDDPAHYDELLGLPVLLALRLRKESAL